MKVLRAPPLAKSAPATSVAGAARPAGRARPEQRSHTHTPMTPVGMRPSSTPDGATSDPPAGAGPGRAGVEAYARWTMRSTHRRRDGARDVGLKQLEVGHANHEVRPPVSAVKPSPPPARKLLTVTRDCLRPPVNRRAADLDLADAVAEGSASVALYRSVLLGCRTVRAAVHCCSSTASICAGQRHRHEELFVNGCTAKIWPYVTLPSPSPAGLPGVVQIGAHAARSS